MIAQKKIRLLTLQLFICSTIVCQNKSDISLLFSSENNKTFIAEYRHPLDEKYLLKFGISVGGNFNPEYTPNPSDFIFATAPSNDYWFIKDRITQVKIGKEYKIKSSVFSVGADLLLGYYCSNTTIYDEIYVTETPYKEVHLNYSQLEFSQPELSRTTRHFLSPGTQISLSMNFDIDDQFLLNLYAANSLRWNYFLTSSDTYDPRRELATKHINFWVGDFSLGIGLRYKIGMEKFS